MPLSANRALKKVLEGDYELPLLVFMSRVPCYIFTIILLQSHMKRVNPMKLVTFACI